MSDAHSKCSKERQQSLSIHVHTGRASVGGGGGGKSKVLWELCQICAPWGCAGLQFCTCIQPRMENKNDLHVGELERTGRSIRREERPVDYDRGVLAGGLADLGSAITR